ncbi:MAG: hypothetical protein QXD23_01585 [Candidatus Micrarchaeaceae archaeon]
MDRHYGTSTIKHLTLNERLTSKKTDEDIVLSYLRCSSNSLNRIIKSNGKERVINAILEDATKNYVSTFDDLCKIKRLKEDKKQQISRTEIATALVLINNGVSFSWENFRLFGVGQKQKIISIFPDFITDLRINKKRVVVEYHSLELDMHKSLVPEKKEENVVKKIIKWGDCIFNKEYYMIFCSDFKIEKLINICQGNLNNFTDIYISGKNFPNIFLKNEKDLKIDIEPEKLKYDKEELIKKLEVLNCKPLVSRKEKLHRYYSLFDSSLKKIKENNHYDSITKNNFFELLRNDIKESIVLLLSENKQ